MRRYICHTSSPKSSLQCPIILERFVSSKSTGEYIIAVNRLLSIQQCRSQTVRHRDKVVIGYLRSVQIDYSIIKIDVRPFQDARFIDAKTGINHQDEDVACGLPTFLVFLVVPGEFILKPLREADKVLGSESANGT